MNCYQSPKSKGNPLLLDKNIRVAIDWAIDKEAIAAVAMSGLAKPASSLLSPVDTFFRWEVPADQLRTYDPEKAKAAARRRPATRSAPTASARTPRATSSSSA